MVRAIVRRILTLLYRVEVGGEENFRAAGERVLIVANHASFLDPVLLWAFLPDEVTFAINTHIAQSPWVKPALHFTRTFPMDPTQPLSIKALTHYLRQDRKAVIFPEGRITVTGSLMKIYDGSGLVADKSGAQVLPVRVDGSQFTPFSRMRGVLRLRWFPKIRIDILPPRPLDVPAELRGDERRKRLGVQLADVMTEMVFATTRNRRQLADAVLEARQIHGGSRIVLEDMQRKPLSYDGLVVRSLILADKLATRSQPQEALGVLLPSAISTVVVLLALQLTARVPAMLNFSAGARNMLAACRGACVKTILTSRRFVEMAKLEAEVAQLAEALTVVYLEDLVPEITLADKLRAQLRSLRLKFGTCRTGDPDAPAVILFTSGSEGAPKGVVLSHANLLSNRAQIAAKVDFNAQDRILNALPLFHSFGLTAGTILPLLSGMYTFLYPSPLHYKIIPEVAYDTNATILFGTNTFLAGYGKHAHPYDFYSMRHVFAGAEKLQAETRRVWIEKFGIRIMEGYGVTETSPVLAVNTPMHFRAGSVGRLMPGIETKLEPVPGIAEGGRLQVRGPNVMLGYLLSDSPGVLIPPHSPAGPGWHDTGDLVEFDAEGYLFIKGRVKRFAKIAGEMVSLTAVEELAARVWPKAMHAAVTIPDPKKGEQIILFTTQPEPDRTALAQRLREDGLSELNLPRELRHLSEIPLLATGKTNYPALSELLRDEVESQDA